MGFFGTPGETTIHQAPGTAAAKPPGYSFAHWLFSQLPGLMNTPYPTYQGSLDPGLSPTLQDSIRRAQGYAQSSPPEILAGVSGTLGRFMNPRQINPWQALYGGGQQQPSAQSMGGGAPMTFGGANNYFGVDPQQRVWGGKPASTMPYWGGQPQPQGAGAPQGPPPVPTPQLGQPQSMVEWG